MHKAYTTYAQPVHTRGSRNFNQFWAIWGFELEIADERAREINEEGAYRLDPVD